MNQWTVILMLPREWRDDMISTTDYVIRLWVTTDRDSVEDAEMKAYEALPASYPQESADGTLEPNDFGTVAIYRGHNFDHFQA